MEGLRRVAQYLLGTHDAHVKLRIQSAGPVTVDLVGYSDSDWPGDPSSRKSQGSVTVAIDSGTLWTQREHDFFFATLWRWDALRNVLDW